MNEPADEYPVPQFYRVARVAYLLIAIGGLVWVGLRDGGVRLAVFFDLESWWLDLGFGALAAGLVLALWSLAAERLKTARELEDRLRGVLQGVTKDQAVGIALISGFSEELLFRGAIQPAWGLLPATVLFALLHSGRGRAFVLWAVFAAAAGLLFGWLAIDRGNLLAPITAHVLINAVNLRRLVGDKTQTKAAAGDDSRSWDRRPD